MIFISKYKVCFAVTAYLNLYHKYVNMIIRPKFISFINLPYEMPPVSY